jgi:hypothetical protein
LLTVVGLLFTLPALGAVTLGPIVGFSVQTAKRKSPRSRSVPYEVKTKLGWWDLGYKKGGVGRMETLGNSPVWEEEN